ncbi:MAG: polysaccharide biosynthesis/export family protein [Phormidesmis sp.]
MIVPVAIRTRIGWSVFLWVYLLSPVSANAQSIETPQQSIGSTTPPPDSAFEIASESAFESSLTNASYRLGPGDRISLTFFNVPEYDGEKQVAVDGSLSLPLIGKLAVSGLTLEETTQAVSRAYANYLRTPLVTVDLVLPRPIQIGISGEVNQPGAYEISLTDSEEETAVEWPTIVEAIQLAGGITDQADIKQIEIRRAQGSGKAQEIIQLNLWEVLVTGNIQNDVTLRHGDAINIPTATALSAEELTQLSAANFSPDSIQVTVVGEVPEPGTLEIVPNAPLNQALLAAGGFDPQRADTETVELIRLNPDGTVSQTTIPIAFDQGINETTNPSLRDNDVVVVGRSSRAAFSDNVDGLFGPVGALLSPFRLLVDLFD